MYETNLAKSGYAAASNSTSSPRSIEYQVFSRITRDLLTAKDSGSPNISKLAHALHENMRMWTILAADVANEKNALSAELRSKIFYLYEFVRHHTPKVLKREAKADVLVDINSSMMRGLRGARDMQGSE